MKLTRKCKDCPTWTQTVCRHAFGVYWCIKSGDGEGCRNPLDDVAEAWRKAGWSPDTGKAVPITLSVNKNQHVSQRKQSSVQLDLIPQPLSDDDY